MTYDPQSSPLGILWEQEKFINAKIVKLFICNRLRGERGRVVDGI